MLYDCHGHHMSKISWDSPNFKDSTLFSFHYTPAYQTMHSGLKNMFFKGPLLFLVIC